MATLFEILGASFSQYKRHFWKYALFSLLILAGSSMLLVYGYFSPMLSGAASLSALLIASLLAMIFLYSWGYASLTLSALYPEAPIGEVANFSLARLPSYIWIVLLVALVSTFGYILLIVPGIFFTSWFLCAIFIYFDGQIQSKKIKGTAPKGITALLKSREIAKGQVLKIFGLFIFIAIFSGLIYGIVSEFLLLANNSWLSLAWNVLFAWLSVPLILVYTKNIYAMVSKNASKNALAKNRLDNLDTPKSSKALILIAAFLGLIIYAAMGIFLLLNGGI